MCAQVALNLLLPELLIADKFYGLLLGNKPGLANKEYKLMA